MFNICFSSTVYLMNAHLAVEGWELERFRVGLSRKYWVGLHNLPVKTGPSFDFDYQNQQMMAHIKLGWP